VNLTGRDFAPLLDPQGRHDIYTMMILGFRQPAVSLFYIAGVGLLCLHLSHGASAMWQSLGWKKNSYAPGWTAWRGGDRWRSSWVTFPFRWPCC